MAYRYLWPWVGCIYVVNDILCDIPEHDADVSLHIFITHPSHCGLEQVTYWQLTRLSV